MPPPTLGNLSLTPASLFPNQVATLTGNISDPGALDTFTLHVNWGDGAAQTTNYAAGTTSFSLSHTYTLQPGTDTNLTVQLTLSDDDGGTNTAGAGLTIKAQAGPAQIQSIVTLPNGHYLLTLHGSPGATYRMESSGDLSPGSWNPISGSSRTADGNGLFQFEETNPLPVPRFYRAIWP